MGKIKRPVKYKRINSTIIIIKPTCKGGKRCKGVNCPLWHNPIVGKK